MMTAKTFYYDTPAKQREKDQLICINVHENATMIKVGIFSVGCPFSSVVCSEKIFTEDGFRDWKKATGATGRLEKHVKSRAHQLSREKAIFRKASIPINFHLSNAEAARMLKIEAEKEENWKIVEVI